MRLFTTFATIGCVALVLANARAVGQETAPAAPAANNPIVSIGEMTRAASDLRNAGEAFERFGKAFHGATLAVAESLAKASHGFDPFGYKTAFRTLGDQSKLLARQRDMIFELQQREIDRLQRENTRLNKQLQKTRQEGRRNKASTKKRKRKN